MPIKMPFVNVYTQFLSVHEHRACSVLFFVLKNGESLV